MPATSPEALARKAERRKQRYAIDNQRRRERYQRSHPDAKPRLGKPKPKRRFVGCDGEGVRRKDGRSDYALFRMGDRALGPFGKDHRRLCTPEILQFICDYPNADDILVGFSFEYDVSNILRDVPWQREREGIPSRLERLLAIDKAKVEGVVNPYPGREGRPGAGSAFQWTWLNFDGWPQFGVSYIPRNHLKVCRAQTILVEGQWRTCSVPGSIRTIFDTFGFFQCSFLKALDTWQIGSLALRERIKSGKDKRSSFRRITKTIRHYCKIECDLLAEMMEAFRDVCVDADLHPRTWNGAGKIAAYLHKTHETVTKEWLAKHVRTPVARLAHAAYYGGRFEVTRIGEVAGPVFEHDINSAYPAAMLTLPCLEHGRWHKQTAGEIKRLALAAERLFVCEAGFTHPPDQFLCGLPFRSKGNKLSWPREGNGVYWSVELRSAERLGATITYRGGYVYERRCECRPFEWVSELYAERQRIGEATRGIPIKLGLNSIYGKLAQRVGVPKWQNPIWAGLITAITRAMLNDAIASLADPRDAIMIATDGLYTVKHKAKVEIGGGLGQWKVSEFPSLFVVKPGLYWPPKPSVTKWKLKSRGLSPKFFESRTGAFEDAWFGYLDDIEGRDLFASMGLASPAVDLPVVEVPIETFTGIRHAYRMGKPEKSCQWLSRDQKISFDWSDKRSTASREGNAVILASKPGDPAAHSLVYTEAGKQEWQDFPADMTEVLFEAMPDYVDLSIPFKD